jgi:pilus assembly protein Flp/PilA
MLDYLRTILAARLADRDERGASAVEYGLLIAGIAALIVAVVFLFGGTLNEVFTDTCNTIANGTTTNDCTTP